MKRKIAKKSAKSPFDLAQGRQKKPQTRGFTLIEMMVAMTIFVLAITFGASTFVGLSRLSGRGIASKDAQQNARFAMETIVRTIRLATEIERKIDNPSNLDEIAVKTDSGSTLSFGVKDNVLYMADESAGENLNNANNRQQITDSSVNISELQFDTTNTMPASLKIILTVKIPEDVYGETTPEYQNITLKDSVVLRGQYRNLIYN